MMMMNNKVAGSISEGCGHCCNAGGLTYWQWQWFIKQVTLRWTRLVLGWMTILDRQTILVS